MPIDEQIATLESKLRIYEAELQNINNPTDRNVSEESPSKYRDSDECEIELMIVILKNFLNQFREAHWDRINP